MIIFLFFTTNLIAQRITGETIWGGDEVQIPATDTELSIFLIIVGVVILYILLKFFLKKFKFVKQKEIYQPRTLP